MPDTTILPELVVPKLIGKVFVIPPVIVKVLVPALTSVLILDSLALVIVPDNVAALVDKQMADEEKYLKQKLKTPVVTHQVGESFDNLPDAREMKGAVIVDEKGNELKSDGSSWKINKK